MPPLRERGDDVVLIARHFVSQLCGELKRPAVQFTADALTALRAHAWPGNIRELRNAVERAVLLAEGPSVGPEDLRLERTHAPVLRDEELDGETFRFRFPSEGVSLKDAERDLILAALQRTNWVQKDAARLLGVTKRAIHYKIEQHGLTHPSWTKNRPKGES